MSTLTIIATVWAILATGITGWLASAGRAGRKYDDAWADWAEQKRLLGREMAKNRDKRVIRP